MAGTVVVGAADVVVAMVASDVVAAVAVTPDPFVVVPAGTTAVGAAPVANEAVPVVAALAVVPGAAGVVGASGVVAGVVTSRALAFCSMANPEVIKQFDRSRRVLEASPRQRLSRAFLRGRVARSPGQFSHSTCSLLSLCVDVLPPRWVLDFVPLHFDCVCYYISSPVGALLERGGVTSHPLHVDW